ncbi:MAG: hypothetical protein EXS37_18575 [Opitutus sp.]|nr:hypothetical protein [Opitutus sp.]
MTGRRPTGFCPVSGKPHSDPTP